MQGDLARCGDGQRWKHPRGKEKMCKLRFRQWKKMHLPFFPSSVFTVVDETSFPELLNGDQRAATLPVLMALAGTVSVQDHLAVLGSQGQKRVGEGRDLRRVGSPTSGSESFAPPVTGFPWPFHGSERKLGKGRCAYLTPSQCTPPLDGQRGMARIWQQPCTGSGCPSISLDLQM